MTVQHKDIPNDGLHEPKGASTASIGQMYISDGAGSGSWANSLANPDDIKVERLLDAISLATSQEPTGLDAPLQIELGAAQFTTADPVSLAADGTVTFNQAGTYRVKVSLAIGRSGGAGVSSIYARAVVNGVQAGQSIHFKIGSADSYQAFTDEAWLTLPAGVQIYYEIMRDSSGNNSGGAFQGMPTPVDWNDNPSAALRVERWSA